MKKTTLALSALALSLGLALSPLSATAAETSSATTAQQMPSLAPMLEKVMPSVVSINVEGSTTVNTPRMPRNFQQFFGDDSPFCQEGSPFQSSPFCQGGQGGNGGGQQQKFMALGSGVIIDADKGYVVTNNHVVDNATVIKVQLSTWWYNAWGFDWLYDKVFVKPFLGIAWLLKRDPLNSMMNIPAVLSRFAGKGLLLSENGYLRWYVASMSIGAVVVLALLMVLR